ncbi:MAG: hypothetical protein H6754_04815 [Candidatus Omnitrophica bacterium]|nr:hypothetical protein [Candidatus Omnitrophota bacterium]
MKNYNPMPLLFVICLLSVIGCERIAFMDDKKSDENVIIVTPVEDPQLAKLIIKPNQKAIQIPRDPFKPIYTNSKNKTDPKKIGPIRTQFSDIYFIGMVKMDQESIALLKNGDKKLMLKVNEQYKGYIVKEINNTRVVFSDGQNQITLKRGGKK